MTTDDDSYFFVLPMTYKGTQNERKTTRKKRREKFAKLHKHFSFVFFCF